jgi:8-oxo-dGTP diphosphatase
MKIDNKFIKNENGLSKDDLIIGPALAVDTLIFSIQDGKLKILLIEIGSGQYKNQWALPGGLVEIDETLGATAKRILKDKAGLKGVYLEQLYTFSKVNRDKRGRVVSVAYFALVDSSKFKLETMEYYSDIDWQDIKKLPRIAFDHKEIINHGLARLRRKLEYTNVTYGLLSKEFTLTEMQKVYEIVWDKKLDKRNFRKQIQALDIIESTGKKQLGAQSRPAELYRFKKRDLVFTK